VPGIIVVLLAGFLAIIPVRAVDGAASADTAARQYSATP
jgi:hypothetical protein